MSLHSCKTHTEARQPYSESIEWPQYKPQEQSMKYKKRMHVNEIKKETRLIIGGEFPNSWAKMKGTAHK